MADAMYEYLDRLFSIVRPRKLLYMAIDGVAPRAKMNQQRSRRFRAAKESAEKLNLLTSLREKLLKNGASLPPEKSKAHTFDSNSITPGTPFMKRLAEYLQLYIQDRLKNDAGWKKISVILSDSSVPGEGEHKIMDFIRRQKSKPNHDANTRHCLYGADADLIMLGLATHERNLTILREKLVPYKPRPCELCGYMGHEMKECTGIPKEKLGEPDELEKTRETDVEFIFIRLNILKNCLAEDLKMENPPFLFDLERVIDDWICLCIFIGNDFLPHLPSLEIREGAIDTLVKLYKKTVYKTKRYLTDKGSVDLNGVEIIMSDLGKIEDEIFKKRRKMEIMYRTSSEKKKQIKQLSIPTPSTSTGTKRKREDIQSDAESEDNVRLWESGWKDRYYEVKFKADIEDLALRRKVAVAYVEGLCWILKYYFHGCPSWNWFYPFHFAPFASDIVNIAGLQIEFIKDEPLKPLEQLMAVLPPGSKQHVPQDWGKLMTDSESSLIDFYPSNFIIDLNGKKYAWQGVALLPFVDERRLLKVLQSVYPKLTKEEMKRNLRGKEKLYMRQEQVWFAELYEKDEIEVQYLEDASLSSYGPEPECIEYKKTTVSNN